jgi:hypothetical protein
MWKVQTMTAKAAPKPKFRQPGQVNLRDLLVVPLLIVVIGYVVITLSTRNPAWFMPTDFTARPTHIEIYHEGQQTTLGPGQASYEQLTEALNEQMNLGIQGYFEVGMSPIALQTALETSTAVILYYDEPLRINSRWNLGEPNRIFVPITGSNSRENRVYTGTENGYGHGALILSDLSTFKAIVGELGYQ